MAIVVIVVAVTRRFALMDVGEMIGARGVRGYRSRGRSGVPRLERLERQCGDSGTSAAEYARLAARAILGEMGCRQGKASRKLTAGYNEVGPMHHEQ